MCQKADNMQESIGQALSPKSKIRGPRSDECMGIVEMNRVNQIRWATFSAPINRIGHFRVNFQNIWISRCNECHDKNSNNESDHTWQTFVGDFFRESTN
jgi:hypothetical protein